ncbi:MAG: S8 family serine peptidase [Thermoplasmatota archaeon]
MIARSLQMLAISLLFLIPGALIISDGSLHDLPYPDPLSKISPDIDEHIALEDGTISLIVQFRDGPLERDRRFLEGLGFMIRRTFKAVPGISVQGPDGLLDSIVKNDRVTYVENNDPVVHDMEMGTHVINATQVWASVIDRPGGVGDPIDGEGVTVCVVDTGIDSGHPDLDYRTKTVKNLYDAGNGNWVEMENTDTNYGHGTHVAGTVAGNGDASAGARRGVAPGANLIGLTVSVPEEATSDLEDGYIQGLEWVYEHSRPGSNPHNIRVVTNSWHSTVKEYDPDTMLTKMIEKITFENNVVSTWSAGNDGREDPEGNELTTSGQGNTPVAIMVGAYERDGSAITDFSSRGRVGANHTYPDIGAPGRSIWSTSARRTVISGGTYLGGNTNPYYLAISGTSMSTPHVAGLAALLWQAAPSLRMSELHEDYSGPDPEGWYSDPNTRIHEIEWIMEASARFLPPTDENGNVGGDTNSTGWGGKPIDYVQGYGLVDARRAVGIALTLQRLRTMCQDPTAITVLDALKAYDEQGIQGTMTFNSTRAEVSWSGEFSRYNDQSMNPLSLVNQTKYVPVPVGATGALVTMTYSGLDTTLFQAADLAFTIDVDGDGSIDHQSDLAVLGGGIDQMEIKVNSEGPWTFDIIGRGLKIPRPLQGTNYVELRVEYDISVTFDLDVNGSYSPRPLNALFAPPFAGETTGAGASIETYSYSLRDVELPVEEQEQETLEEGIPWGLILILIILLVLATVAVYVWKRKRSRSMNGENGV